MISIVSKKTSRRLDFPHLHNHSREGFISFFDLNYEDVFLEESPSRRIQRLEFMWSTCGYRNSVLDIIDIYLFSAIYFRRRRVRNKLNRLLEGNSRVSFHYL